jgi:mannose-6-phosphate isomerase-like protein (cupin superfamily)
MSAATSSRGYVIRRLTDAPTVPCSCGESTRPLTALETGSLCNLHVTHIVDSVRHHHKKTTEVYYILEGRGKIELNDEVYDVEPGMIIYIEPGTWHRAWGDIRTIVFGVPAFRADDEYYE